jgi:hypothetical protein
MLSTDSKLSAIRRWPTDRSKEWVEHYLSSAESEPKILAVIAVGSSVRDVLRSNDIDLIAISNENPVSTQEFPPLEIDFRLYSSEGLEDKIKSGNDYLGWAIHFGKVLHDKDEYWAKLVGRLEGKVPMPSPQVARERAAIAAENLKSLLKVGDSDAALEQVVTLLTHVGRAVLIEAGVYPASRPELPSQLSAIGHPVLAKLLTSGIEGTSTPERLLSEFESNPEYKSQPKISP